MPHSAAVNFSSPKFLCRCIINSLSSCGKFKKKTPPYQLFTFLKKLQTFHSKNISLAYFLLYRKKKKKSTYFSLWIHGSPFPIILLGRGGVAVIMVIYLCQNTSTPAGLTLVYFIFQCPLCAHIHMCVKIQVSQEKASFFLFSCTISLSTAFGSKR